MAQLIISRAIIAMHSKQQINLLPCLSAPQVPQPSLESKVPCHQRVAIGLRRPLRQPIPEIHQLMYKAVNAVWHMLYHTANLAIRAG
jgi:hypothetical protein